jgi:hypothetical protein
MNVGPVVGVEGGIYSFYSLPNKYLPHSLISPNQLLFFSPLLMPNHLCPYLSDSLRCLAQREYEIAREDQDPSFLSTW